MYITTTGLVLRETPYKESSRILTVLTASEGKITVSARGAKRRGSKLAASTQFLSFSELTLFTEKERHVLTEARSVELFLGLRESLEALALASWFAELMDNLADADAPNPELLSLGLNALYALSEGRKPRELVKAAVELRVAALAGYAPNLAACAVCGREPVEPVLSLPGGVVRCRACASPEALPSGDVPLRGSTLQAMRFILSAPPKRFCAFSVEADTLRELSRAAEDYLLTQLGRSFGTLDYYHSL